MAVLHTVSLKCSNSATEFLSDSVAQLVRAWQTICQFVSLSLSLSRSDSPLYMSVGEMVGKSDNIALLAHACPTMFYIPLVNINIGVSLSEPHTSVTALHTHVCLFVCWFGLTTYRKF